MKISARVDYGLQAITQIAVSTDTGERISAEAIARRHKIPYKFLEGILAQLKAAELLVSHRGNAGGYELARHAADITIADVVRAIDGPLASVRDQAPEAARYAPPISNLTKIWIATRVALREVLEEITLQDLITDKFPSAIARRIDRPDAWRRRK